MDGIQHENVKSIKSKETKTTYTTFRMESGVQRSRDKNWENMRESVPSKNSIKQMVTPKE